MNDQREEPRAVLTAQQAGELLQLTAGNVRALARAGLLPGRRVGEQWRFSRRQLIDWVANPDSGWAIRDAAQR